MSDATRDQAQQFFALFQGNNSTAHYVHGEDDTPKGWYRTENRALTPADAQRHLRGEEPSILSIPIRPTGNCHFADGDVDCHDEQATPVDHAVLAKRVTELQLPLVVTRSRRGGGAHLTLFFKEPEGCPAADARRLIAHYLDLLNLKGEIFPKQSDSPEKLGSGINLPYFGGERVGFGEGGKELSLVDFLALATKRQSYGALLINRLPKEEKQASGSAPTSERPWSIFTARKVHADNLQALRSASEGEGNRLLNTSAFFCARAFAAGVFEETEGQLKKELLDIVTKEWKSAHDEHGARGTIRSGWTSGIAKPLSLVDWKKKFHTGAELETGDVKLYIEGILPEGVTALGALSAAGKTWLALSMARALTTGTQFLGVFAVPEAVPVIYLVPEMGSRALRKRLERMRIPMNDRFYCQTVSDGVCQLNDPTLEAAVAELRPVVFLDTAVRFNQADNENDARQNAAMLASDIFRLRRWGACAVVCLHHSPKYSSEAEFMTLENVLRGTGDLGAMCDAVWGLQHDKRKADNGKDWDYEYLEESQELTRLLVRCVKPRDFDAAPAFRVQGRPWIDKKGDFVVLADDSPELKAQIVAAIEQNPKLSARSLMDKFHVGFERLKKVARENGWQSGKKGWVKRDASSDPRDQGEPLF